MSRAQEEREGKPRLRWMPDQVQHLRDRWPTSDTAKEIGAPFGFTAQQIYDKARCEGLGLRYRTASGVRTTEATHIEQQNDAKPAGHPATWGAISDQPWTPLHG